MANIVQVVRDLKRDIKKGKVGGGISVGKYLYYNYFCPNVVRYGSGRFIPYKSVSLCLHPTARIYIYGDKNFEFGIDAKKNDTEKTSLLMEIDTVWYIRNGGRLGRRSSIILRDYAVFDTGYFTSNAFLSVVIDKKVTLGDDIMMGPWVRIVDTDFHQFQNSKSKQMNSPKEVVIGNHVWVGERVVIWKASVGANSVIASYVVVKKRVPEGSMVAQGGDSIRVVPLGDNFQWNRASVLKNTDIFSEAKIILFGYGINGKEFRKQFEKQVCYVVDNGVKEEGVYSFGEFRRKNPVIEDYIWVIASTNYYVEMKKLVEKYYPDMKIYFAR